MTTPGPIDATATFTPSQLTNTQVATASTAGTGDGTGDYHLIVNYTEDLTDPTVDGEVVLPGGCAQQQTTTTTSTTSSTTSTTSTTQLVTTSTAAAAAVTASPSFTG